MKIRMGSKRTGQVRAIARGTSLPPLHYGHLCKECRKFFPEFPDIRFMRKNYCNKWMKKVDPTRIACKYFAVKIRRQQSIDLIKTKKRAKVVTDKVIVTNVGFLPTKVSKQKMSKKSRISSSTKITRASIKPARAQELSPSLKHSSRVNGRVMESVGEKIPSLVESSKGPCSCSWPVIRTPKSDMRNGTRTILCKCTRCGRSWTEGSG